MIFWWYLDDMFGWYLDDMWVISGWNHSHIIQISPITPHFNLIFILTSHSNLITILTCHPNLISILSTPPNLIPPLPSIVYPIYYLRISCDLTIFWNIGVKCRMKNIPNPSVVKAKKRSIALGSVNTLDWSDLLNMFSQSGACGAKDSWSEKYLRFKLFCWYWLTVHTVDIINTCWGQYKYLGIKFGSS